ncbi:hypothetical protein DENSPDRAFT_854755 [Dentipellis sp. KUC8613]|nr:hypothetical protein DENSPDRAFT_854755 [Dentipellis sp. KUC8613]
MGSPGESRTFVFNSAGPAFAMDGSVDQFVQTTTSRRSKLQAVAANTERRQSSRATRGQGGAAAQLEKAGVKVQEKAVRRGQRFQPVQASDNPDVPMELNPMAPSQPEPRQRRGRKQKGDVQPPPPGPMQPAPAPEAPQFLVPPGTEPPLNNYDEARFVFTTGRPPSTRAPFPSDVEAQGMPSLESPALPPHVPVPSLQAQIDPQLSQSTPSTVVSRPRPL